MGVAPGVVAGPSVEPELLERGDALAILDDAFAATRAGCGRLVFVSGEAGIGKSALVRRFCNLRAGEVRVLWGACDGLWTPRPLGPFVDIGAAVDGRLRQALTAADVHTSPFDALVEDLRSLERAVVVLEDVHWADEASLDVLGLLGRRVGGLPALVVATYRSDELPRVHPLRIVLGDLSAVQDVRRVRLAPLSVAAVTELASPYGVDADDLYAKTGGNPFYVTEALASGSETVPPTVRDAVFARSGRLGPTARGILDAVAIVPQPTELWLLEALVGTDLGALDECLASGILHTDSEAVVFRHELARLAIEESIPPHRLVRLHGTAVEALRTPPNGQPDLARLAHHADAAGDGAAVLEFAPVAAVRAAAVGAHREAAAQYARALRFGEALPELERAELLDARAHECHLTDQHADSIAAVAESVELYRRLGDIRKEALALIRLASMRWCASDTTGAEQGITDAVALLEPLGSSEELAHAYGKAASVAMNLEKAELAFAWAKRARALPAATATTIALLNDVGTMKLLLGRPEGVADLDRSIALAVQHGLEADAGRGYMHLGWAGSRVRNWEAAARLDAGIEYCTERGLELWRFYLFSYRARVELDRGRWDAAAESASFVLGQPRQAPLLKLLALTALATVRIRRGDPGTSALLDEALAIADGKRDLQHLAPVAIARTELAALTHDPAQAAEASDAVLALAADRDAAWIVGELAFWRWRAGLDEPAPEGETPFAVHLSGDHAGAVEAWQRLGCPYEAALALADTGEEDALRRALEELRALGAGPAAEEIARRLRARGAVGITRGPRPSTRENPFGLTARQADVLELLVEGLRNAEIAERLFLSRRTVDHHVSAILSKLDVRTRAEAVAATARPGLGSET